MRPFTSLTGLIIAAATAGCTHTQYVPVMVPTPLRATPQLQACVDHAAQAQRTTFGEAFRGLQFDTAQMVATAPQNPVGQQKVGLVFDGNGTWWGRPQGTQGEWRRVRFHCLFNPAGQVVYSFVRSE
jgi:hypothetical protein